MLLHLFFLALNLLCTYGQLFVPSEGLTEVTGATFDQIVKDPTKDVLLQFYSPTCQYCVRLIPVWEELGKKFLNETSVVIARIDSTQQANWIPSFPIMAFPTIYLFRANGNGIGEKRPIEYTNHHRTTNSFVEFLLAEAGLPIEVKIIYRSEPEPENSGPLKKVVGTTFHDIVMDPHKDVIVNFYAPWCPYSVALEPTWQDLATRFANVPSLTVAAYDDTQNEVPGLHVHAYPTIMFYPAEDKANPHTFRAANRYLETIVSFAMAHATIPFTDPVTGRTSQNVHQAPEVPPSVSAAREIVDATAWEQEITQQPGQSSFVMLYAPWCSHSKELFPVWDELATSYHFVDGILIAKYDATQPNAPLVAQTKAYPTLRFYPANAKDTPVDYKGPKTAQNMREFVMKQAPKKQEAVVDTLPPDEEGRQVPLRPEGVPDAEEGRVINEREGYAHKQSMKVKAGDEEVKDYL